MDPVAARKTWRTLEPIHGMIYFAPEAAEEYAAIGIEGRSGYFASRAAPMGAVSAGVVAAAFFNFNPIIVGAAIPSVWGTAAPGAVSEARLRAADRALGRMLGPAVTGSHITRAADLARRAALEATEHGQGRPLFAGHAGLPWPDADVPHLVLWHAQSLLREFRGDGHVAVLAGDGLSAVEALVLHAATGDVSAGVLQSTRGWDDEAWEAGVASVRARGWLSAGPELALNDAGRTHRQCVEDRTDELSVPAYRVLGEDGCTELRDLARPLSRAVVDSGVLGPR